MKRRLPATPSSARAFTLIELLVVISIIGMLASIVLVALNGVRAKARDAQRQENIHQIELAIEEYASSNSGKYPSDDGDSPGTCPSGPCGGWGTLGTDLAPYISTFPNDPLGSFYNAGNPAIYRFYTYWTPADVIYFGTTCGVVTCPPNNPWNWASTPTTPCDGGKYLLIAYGTETPNQRNDCGFNSNIMSILFQ